MELKKQNKEKLWTNETGMQIPADRVSVAEKLKESQAFLLATNAVKISNTLKDFKEQMRKSHEAVIAAVRTDNQLRGKEMKDGKGNLSWFNFDRSIKFECSVNEQIDFDDLLLASCKEKLNEFISRTIDGSDNALMIQALVKDAFENTRGKLDAKKVMSLLKHKSTINSVLYQEAMEFLEKSICRPGSKTYYRVSVRQESGEYEVINLNISSI